MLHTCVCVSRGLLHFILIVAIRLAAQKAAIGYKYEENTVPSAQQEAAAAELARLIGKTDEISSGAAGSAPPADGGGGGGDGGDSSDEDGVLRDRGKIVVCVSRV